MASDRNLYFILNDARWETERPSADCDEGALEAARPTVAAVLVAPRSWGRQPV